MILMEVMQGIFSDTERTGMCALLLWDMTRCAHLSHECNTVALRSMLMPWSSVIGTGR